VKREVRIRRPEGVGNPAGAPATAEDS
jgi:hypothetical protein